MCFFCVRGRVFMEFDIWKPLYADKFDCNKYLYHYTNFETAIKIISGNLPVKAKLNIK